QTRHQTAVPRETISGTILDPSGAAIASAQVTLSGTGGKTLAATKSSIVGAFRFENVELGRYDVQVEAKGFQKARVTVVLGAKPQAIHIVMTIASERQVITVQSGESSPQVSPEISRNQNANIIDRPALDRVPVFDQDYIT